MFRLDGKVAFVTGAGSGIGEQIARIFASQGARVVVSDIDEGLARRVSADIGPQAHWLRLDVTNAEHFRTWLPAMAEEYGSLDVLVNNAGIGFVGNIQETTEADFHRLMDINVNGVFYGCKYAIPLMLRQGHGNIINMGSVAGLVGVERRLAYGTTKGAVIALSRQLAIDYATKGIRINCICPGTVQTPFVEDFLHRFHTGEVEETRHKLHARQPIGRMGRPEEIARLALYLASDDSEFVTGANMIIDGGWTAR